MSFLDLTKKDGLSKLMAKRGIPVPKEAVADVADVTVANSKTVKSSLIVKNKINIIISETLSSNALEPTDDDSSVLDVATVTPATLATPHGKDPLRFGEKQEPSGECRGSFGDFADATDFEIATLEDLGDDPVVRMAIESLGSRVVGRYHQQPPKTVPPPRPVIKAKPPYPVSIDDFIQDPKNRSEKIAKAREQHRGRVIRDIEEDKET